jgi:hypothetical protein
MYDYNSISNRLLKAEFEDYKGVLKKFLAFISDCPVICAYLEGSGSPTIPDIAEEVKEVVQSDGDAIFSTGDTPAEETANILAILHYLADSNMEIHYVVQAYSNSRKFNDVIKSFNERFVLILIRHIESYLTKMGIDMGLDENVKYNITVTNGQVNVANDTATINATLNNGFDGEKLQQLISEVQKACSAGLSENDAETAQGSLEVIQEELSKPKPRKGFIQTAITALSAIKGTAEFAAAVVALVQFVQTVI